MSRFTRYAATSQSLSLAAMEEASRRGLREADLPDLFLALTLSDQHAGRILRNLGVTIETARTAVEEYQRDQIASLGLTASLPAAGDIVFHETGGYEWSKRAMELINRAGKKGQTADAAAVLRELLDEPSGVVTDLLEQLNTTPTMVITGLDQTPAETTGKKSTASRRRGELVGVNESFIPAPLQDVWALLSDPTRVPEWEPAIEAVDTTAAPSTAMTQKDRAVDEEDHTGAQVGTMWAAHARTTHPNGTPLKVNEKYRRRTLELLQVTPHTRIEWRLTYPDMTGSPPVTTTFELTPATGGTQLTTTMTWAKREGWRALLSPALLPLRRFLIWIRLTQISGSISRAFR